MEAMTPEVYELWRESWQNEHAGRIPPAIDQTNRLMAMFGITVEEIFGFDSQES